MRRLMQVVAFVGFIAACAWLWFERDLPQVVALTASLVTLMATFVQGHYLYIPSDSNSTAILPIGGAPDESSAPRGGLITVYLAALFLNNLGIGLWFYANELFFADQLPPESVLVVSTLTLVASLLMAITLNWRMARWFRCFLYLFFGCLLSNSATLFIVSFTMNELATDVTFDLLVFMAAVAALVFSGTTVFFSQATRFLVKSVREL